MTTIYDIANHTGLSPATVSRVLSGKKTGEANRQKVLEAARELNYHNMAYTASNNKAYYPARSKQAGSNMIILIPGRNGCDGIYDAACDFGYSVQLVNNLDRSGDYVRTQLEQGAALGLLIFSSFDNLNVLRDCAQNCPVVVVGTVGNICPVNCVWIDYSTAISRLLEELRRCGCHRIWCGISAFQRVGLNLWQDSDLVSASLEFEEFKTFDVEATFFSQAMKDHISFVDELLALPKSKRPDGLIMPNSVVASCVVNLLRIRGVKVPEEIAVVSLLGGEHDGACEPMLTSILPPFYELGYEGMRILDSLINGKVCPQNVWYPHKIHYGGSTRAELGSFGELVE